MLRSPAALCWGVLHVLQGWLGSALPCPLWVGVQTHPQPAPVGDANPISRGLPCSSEGCRKCPAWCPPLSCTICFFPLCLSSLPGPWQTVLAFSAQVSSAKEVPCPVPGREWGLLRALPGRQETSDICVVRRGSLADEVLGACPDPRGGVRRRRGDRGRVITVLNQVCNNGLLCKSSSAQRGVFKDVGAFVPRGMSFMVN